MATAKTLPPRGAPAPYLTRARNLGLIDEEQHREMQRLVDAGASPLRVLSDAGISTSRLADVVRRQPASTSRALLDGKLDRYDVESLIASGGMGEVYLAYDPRLERKVALKLLRPSAADSTEAIERFRLEARTAAALRHAHIVRTLDFGVVDGIHYLAQELVEGSQTLTEYAVEQSLTRRQRVTLFLTVVEAVAHAHAQGVIHRDLKPSNILVDQDGHAWLTDFGLAFRVDSQRMTQTGEIIGTPAYMAPEQARGERDRIDERADVYGLGAVLYELLTGRAPFEGETVHVVIYKVLDELPTDPLRIDAAIARDLASICLTCLHKEPEDRYASVEDLRADCQRFLEGEAILASGIGLLSRVMFEVRRQRRRWQWPIAAVLLTAILVAQLAPLADQGTAFDRAVTAMEQGRADEAGALLREWTAEHPRHLGGWLRLAALTERAGDHRDTVAALDRALQISDAPTLRVRRGKAWLGLGDHARAAIDFDHAVEVERDNLDWLELAYAAHDALGNAERAASLATRIADFEIVWRGCGVSRKAFMTACARTYQERTGVRINLSGGGATLGIETVAARGADVGGTCRGCLKTRGEDRLGLELVLVAWDALVPVVHPTNPIDRISQQQLVDAMRGRTTSWAPLGGAERELVFVARKGSTSGVGLTTRRIILGSDTAKYGRTAVKLASTGPVESFVERHPEALAITGVSSARQRRLKILAVDGVVPSQANIASGAYPYYRPLYLAIRAPASPKVRRFIRWILGPDGQAIISAQGTVSLRDGRQLARRFAHYDDPKQITNYRELLAASE